MAALAPGSVPALRCQPREKGGLAQSPKLFDTKRSQNIVTQTFLKLRQKLVKLFTEVLNTL